jgi:ATP-dependent RNA helicase DDX60
LHAVYAVDRFLRQLVSRKCKFHIAFFDELEDICAQIGTENGLLAKYLLARAVVIRHLQRNLPADLSILVQTFRSYRDPNFIRYLDENGIYFVMCHDGASPAVKVGRDNLNSYDDQPEAQNSEKQNIRKENMSIMSDSLEELVPFHDSNNQKTEPRLRLRTMILWFIAYGYNVSLINELEFIDTKVHTTN